jgi:hypothetical protein
VSRNVKTRAITLAAGLLALLATARPAPAADRVPPGTPQLPLYQTRHYQLHTDVPVDLAQDLARRLDAMFEEYAQRLSAFGTGDVPRLDVWVFARKADYARFVGDKIPNTGGVFMPGRGCLAVFLEGQGRDALRRTLQHEAFHQFADAAISPNLPVWVNEGIAQLFEEGIYAGSRFVIAQVPQRRIRQLEADMKNGRLMPFEAFLAMDHQTWAANMADRERGATQYNQAWAMVHFLVYARDGATGKFPYRNLFFEMLQQVRRGVAPDVAFRNCYGLNYVGFQRRFVEYARSLTATPESTYVENAEVLSDLMAEILNSERRKFRSLVDFRTHLERGGYQLQYSKGPLRWTTERDVSVYFRDVSGRDLPAAQCNFMANPGAPLPDLILRPPPATDGVQLEYRARFFLDADGKADREIVVRSY